MGKLMSVFDAPLVLGRLFSLPLSLFSLLNFYLVYYFLCQKYHGATSLLLITYHQNLYYYIDNAFLHGLSVPNKFSLLTESYKCFVFMAWDFLWSDSLHTTATKLGWGEWPPCPGVKPLLCEWSIGWRW